MFINFSNHPSHAWGEDQRKAAEKYGKIMDIPYPQVDPSFDSEKVRSLAEKYVELIIGYSPKAVLCQGEFTLCYNVVNALKQHDVVVVAACSQRMVEETPEGKTVKFVFEGFREY